MEHLENLPSRRNARIGLVLFAFYLAVYGGFVLLHVFAPSVMQAVLPMGVNVAVLYGLSLIVVAFVLAVFYGWLCREPAAGDGNSGLPDREQPR